MPKTGTDKKKKSFFYKGLLATAFTIAALNPKTLQMPAEADPAPQNITLQPTFSSVTQMQRIKDVEYTEYGAPVGNLSAAMSRQEKLMKDPENAALFNNFVAAFAHLKDASQLEKVKAVNDVVNARILYTEDSVLYKKKEYWASPIETLKHGRGDCEDYAILKYATLRALGVPENDLYLAGVDGFKEGNLNHEVLLVNLTRDPQQEKVFDISDMKGEIKNISEFGYTFYALVNKKGCWGPKEKLKTINKETEETTTDPSVLVFDAAAGAFFAAGVLSGIAGRRRKRDGLNR